MRSFPLGFRFHRKGHRIKVTPKCAKRVAVVVLLFLLVFSPQLNGIEENAISSTQSAGTSQSFPYTNNALSSLNIQDRITLPELQAQTGGQLTVPSFEKLIANQFLTYNLRRVLLDIGWQNYSVGTITPQSWVSNWLTACDQLGIQNAIYLGQFTASGIGSPWISSLLLEYPNSRTFNSAGQPAVYVSPDDPDVISAVESDLALLDSYYGNHSSWIGIGTGYPLDDPYYQGSQVMPILGYSNLTLQNFENSVFFARDVNSTGFHSDGTKDNLWSSFRTPVQPYVLSAGNWMTSTQHPVFPTSGGNYSVQMRFYLPQNEQTIDIRWYGSRVGNPGPLVEQIFGDANGTPELNNKLASQTESTSSISSSVGWQNPVQFSGSFSAGYYWITFSAQTGDNSDNYGMYTRDYVVDPFTANSLLGANGKITGSSILWITDSSSNNLALYPYENALVSPATVQTFVAQSSFNFNTVYLFLSDRHFNPVNGTLTVTDATTNTVLTSGVLSQSLTRGLQNWIPITLESEVTTIQGHTYKLALSEPSGGVSWVVALRGLIVDPLNEGFQNQSSFWLFRLALTNWGDGHWDYTDVTSNGRDAVTSGTEDAIRFVPSSSETLQSLSILMKNLNSGGNYSSGSLTAAIYSSTSGGTAPGSTLYQSVSVAGTSVPKNGWLNFTGFSVPVSAGQYYWVVFFTSVSNFTFPFARLTSPYSSFVQASHDGGLSWGYPQEGPTEFSYSFTFTGETISNFIDDIPIVNLPFQTEFAQPFIATNNTQADGVYIGPLRYKSLGSYISVSLVLDSGGKPSSTVLASGNFYSVNITLPYGPQFVPFSSVARLTAGQKYWIVVRSLAGIFSVQPVSYSTPPSGWSTALSALISNNGGLTWNKLGNATTLLDFRIATPFVPLPSYSTSELYADLAQYHNSSTSSGILSGWNAYIQSSELRSFNSIASWFETYSGKSQFIFFTSGQPNVFSQLGYSNIVLLPEINTLTSCSAIEASLLSQTPLTNEQYREVGSFSLLQSCSPSLKSLAQELNYIFFASHPSGILNATRVLIVGDSSSDNLTNYLSPAFNVKYLQFESDPELASVKGGIGFPAIIWLSQSSPPVRSNLSVILTNYVSQGGDLVVVNQPKWLEALFKLNASLSGPVSNSVLHQYQIIFDKITSNTGYSSRLSVKVLNNTFASASGSGLSIQLADYGIGHLSLVDFASSVESTQISDNVVLLSNILSSVSIGGTSPFWYSSGENSGLIFSLTAGPSRSLALWVSNPSQSPVQFTINLNASSYGIPSAWSVLNVPSLELIPGSGANISVKAIVPPMNWSIMYVLQLPGVAGVGYSNSFLSRQLSFPNQALYSFESPANQSVLFVVSTRFQVGSVLTNDNNLLSEFDSKTLLAGASSGWLYNDTTGILLAKYVSSGSDMIRASSIIPSTFPLSTSQIIQYALLGMVAVDVSIYALVRFRRSRFQREK